VNSRDGANGDLVAFSPVGELEEEQTFQDYTVRVYGETKRFPVGEGSFEILRGGRRIYADKGGYFSVGTACEGEKDTDLTAMGKDITGTGRPTLVLEEVTGGAHCCLVLHIFEIGKEFRKIATLDVKDAMNSCFKDLDGDANLELMTRDVTFAYWRTSFGDSPMPDVILRFHNGAYRVATDLMRKPAPADQELAEEARKVREAGEWNRQQEPPTVLWAWMLDLIYAGHAELAWKFFEMAWPSDRPVADEFLHDFRGRLAEGPYWSDIEAMNKRQ
jgi:hypothetical protein